MSAASPPPSEPTASRHPVPSDPKEFKRFAKRLRDRAEHLEASGAKLIGKHGHRLSPDALRALQERLAQLKAARLDRKAGSIQALIDAVEDFDELLEAHLGSYRKSVLREYVEAIAWAVALTLVIRAFVFEAFKIPTGSMIPTLQVHDHLFVNKFLYGLKIPFTRIKFLDFRQPRPGEVVVFEYPYDDDPDSTGKDLIKRVIAVGGDRVRMIDNVLYVGGKPVKRKVIDPQADCTLDGLGGPKCRLALECLGGFVYTTQHLAPGPDGEPSFHNTPDWPPAVLDPTRSYGPNARIYAPPENGAFPEFVVPQGYLLVMGDNRDNSKDGRFFGLVPLSVVKGKAGILWYATDLKRIGSLVHKDAPEGSCEKW